MYKIKVLVAENDHGVAIWDIATDSKLTQLDGYSFPVVWNSDGTMLALKDIDNQIVLWDVAKQREHLVISVDRQKSPSSIRFLAWNAEKIVGITSDYDASTMGNHTIFLVWSSRTGDLLSTVQPDSSIGSLDASPVELVDLTPSTSEIILTGNDHFLRFDTQNEHPLVVSENRTRDVYDLAISPDRKHFAVIDQTLWQISIWDTETLTLLNTISDGAEVSESVSHIAWSPDSKYLLTDAPGIIKIWDIETGLVLHQSTDYMTQVNDLAWSPDGRLLATAHGQDFRGVWDFRIRLWNMRNQSIFSVCEGATAPVRSVNWNPEGTKLVTSGGGFHFSDNQLRIWNVTPCKTADTAKLKSGMWSVSAWSSDGHYIATQVVGNIEIREVNNLSEEPRILITGLTEGVVWHPIHPWLAVDGGRDNVKIFDAADAKIYTIDEPRPKTESLQAIPTYIELIRTLTWDSSGAYLAIGGGDFVANEPEKDSNDTIEIWNTTTSTLEYTLVGHEDGITALAWDPTGRYLASASTDHTVRVWDTTTGEQLVVLEGHTNVVSTVAWSPDGSLLASGSHDGTVRIWGR